MSNPRVCAARLLQDILQQRATLNDLSQYAQDQHLSDEDQALYKELCFGVCRFQPRLSGCIDQLLDKPLRKKDGDIYALLLLGAYQLSYLRIPDHAAIHSTVAGCELFKKNWAKKLVNGVLRQYQRRHEDLLNHLDRWQRDAHPQWLADALYSTWPEHYQQIIEANNHYPPFCLRINRLQTTRQSYLDALPDEWQAVACEFATDGIRLAKAVDVQRLPGFSLGQISVQDEAAQLAADLLLPAAGERVLDACAAPGGKTAHLLEREPQCRLLALDQDSQRCAKISENLQRLQLSAQIVCADATKPANWWDNEPFDAILLDAPCSASGVMRRHPDIKQLRRADDIAKLAHQQYQLLESLWQCLAPGGRLLYATCSILPEENEQVVERFCHQHDNAVHVALSANWGIERRFGRQLLPRIDGHDGFYYALLRKTLLRKKTIPHADLTGRSQ